MVNKELDAIYESDEYVESYHNEPGVRLNRLVEQIDFSPKDVVLDIACGNALLLDLIHTKIKKYVGTDISNKFINISKARAKEMGAKSTEFIVHDMRKPLKTKNRFDKAFSFDFTEHIDDEDLIKIFSNVRTVLAPKGKLYIHTPNGEYFLEILKNKGIMKQVSGHIGVRSFQEYKKLFEKAGYRNIQVKFLNHYLTVLKPLHVLSYLPIIGKFFKARLFMTCSK